MKRFITLLLALTLLLSLCACGAPKSISIQQNGQELKKLELDLNEEYDEDELTLTAVLEPKGAKAEIKWESSDKSVVKVKDKGDGTCTLKLRGEGNAKITASCGDLSAKVKVSVEAAEAAEAAEEAIEPAEPVEEAVSPSLDEAEAAAEAAVDAILGGNKPGTEAPAVEYSPDVEFVAYDYRTGEDVSSDMFCCYDVIMINFWEPWCGPCVGEMPELQEIWEEYDGHDMGLLMIGVFSTEDGVAEVLEETGVTYPIIAWRDCFEKYETGYVPTTVFLDGSGEPIMLSSADQDGYIFIGSRDKAGWLSIIEEAYEALGFEY